MGPVVEVTGSLRKIEIVKIPAPIPMGSIDEMSNTLADEDAVTENTDDNTQDDNTL